MASSEGEETITVTKQKAISDFCFLPPLSKSFLWDQGRISKTLHRPAFVVSTGSASSSRNAKKPTSRHWARPNPSGVGRLLASPD